MLGDQIVDMNEAEYLGKLRDHVIETRRIFSEAMKPERERMVCRAFLRCLGVAFSDCEIQAPAQEPVDVIFRSASFQIRELMEPNCKRGDELKEFQQKIAKSSSIEDLMTSYQPPSPMSLSQLAVEVKNALTEKCQKYGRGCNDLDALVYVNLSDTYLNASSNFPDLSDLRAQGWRSVSVLFAPYSLVLCATGSAPSFLRASEGCSLARWDDLDRLFQK